MNGNPQQEKAKPEVSRQYGLHLDSAPTDEEEVHVHHAEEHRGATHEVRHYDGHVAAGSHKTTRKSPLCRSLARERRLNFLEELLNEENFQFERSTLVAPDWNSCLEYEFLLHKEALRLVREQGSSIQASLWQAYSDPQHRMRHWIRLLTVANAKKEVVPQKGHGDRTTTKKSSPAGAQPPVSRQSPEASTQFPAQVLLTKLILEARSSKMARAKT